MLQIRLLGQFDIRIDGKRVTIPSRAGQSLLAYLALTAGTLHRREKLAGTFWPDTTDEIARRNLRQELWRIRKAISTQGSTDNDYLIADEYTLRFNRDSKYWLDVAQMARPDRDLQSLIANLSLYQGELLPGFYDEWITLERERIQAVFDARMEELLEQLTSAERWIAVQEWGERWLTLSGAREPAYRGLMLASGVRGDMAKVASHYQRCMDELMEHLGVEPSAETRALYDGLLKGTKVARAPAQPSGTITFLFTDIEGSTRLLEKMGAQYAVALSEHHELLRAAIQKWNGREMDTQGDAFFITFTRAIDAVQCAAEAQRALQSHSWHQGEALRVRIGLHTGEPLIASTGYVGMDVHRAARIGDAGHGGQILLSQTTRELVVQDLPQGMTIRDLGEHRLKDMKFPTPIYQLVVEGLPADFAPIRTKFTGTESPTPGEAPFKGLQFFDVEDSELFFGREMLTAKLVKRLHDANFLSVIIGASGSGKSSLVRAGVVPAIRKGSVLIDGAKPPKGSADWRIHILTPTAHPLEALAIELTRDSESVTAAATLADDLSKDPRSLHFFLSRQAQIQDLSHTLLVIDQFEELFTLCRDHFEREAFIDNLLTALTPSPPTPLPVGEGLRGEGNLTLILTLRADFYAHLAQYPELRDAFAQQQEYIGPMTSEELRRAIEEPARRGHWEFEPGLVDLILRDIGDEPGALPLLSHALLETWKRRAGHTLTLKGYADAGGVRGAIAHTAESVFQSLSLGEQTIMRNILLRLTEFGEGTEDTRRRASFDELMSSAEDADEVHAVLNKLAEARLVTLSEDTAEVAHEALIREWPQLREWLSQDREGIILHRHLTEAAQEWELLERDADVLYRGARLAQAREWAALHPNALNVGEKAFLEASNALEQRQVAEREAQRQRELEAAQKLAETERARAEEQTQSSTRLRTRNRVITTVAGIAVILAMLAGMFGVQSNQNAQKAQTNLVLADQQRNIALNAQATAQAERDHSDEIAKLSFSRELAVQSQLSLTIDPERSILLALAALNKADTLEAENALHQAVYSSRLRMTLRGHKSGVEEVAYSPDGKLIASVGDDGARLWDAATGKQLFSLQHPTPVRLVLFSPDGTRLITGATDGLVRIWDVASSKQLLSIDVTHTTVVDFFTFSVAISPDGKLLATTNAEDGFVKLWDFESGTELFAIKSPDWLAVAPGVNLSPAGLAFSRDGHLAISFIGFWQGPGRIEIWDVVAHRRMQTLNAEFDIYTPPNFSPDGTRLVARDGVSGDVWDVASGKLLFTFRDRNVNSVRYSVDGKRLLVAGGGGLPEVFDAETGELLLTLFGTNGRVGWVAGSPDCVKPPEAPFDWCGTRLASAGEDGSIRIWDISPAGEEELLTLPGDDFVLSPDGTRLNTITYDIPRSQTGGTVTIEQRNLLPGFEVDPASGYTSSSLQLGDGSHEGFSMDGILAIPFDNGPIKFYDLTEGGKPLYPISCCTWTQDMHLTFSSRLHPRIAITYGDTGEVMIWDLARDVKIQTLQVTQPNTRVSDTLYFMLLSPDGEHLVITRNDGTVETWDATSGQKLLTLPDSTTPGGGASDEEIGFSPDGKLLVVTNCTGTQVVLDAMTGEKLRSFHRRGCTFGLGISADDRFIALRGPESKIYNLETGQEVVTLPILSGPVQFTPDDSRVIMGFGSEYGSTVGIFLLRLEDLVALAKTRVTRSLTTEECQQYLHVEQCLSMP